MRRRPLFAVRAVLAVSSLLLMTACAGSVDVVPPDPETADGASQEACADLSAELPDQIVGQESRTTSPDSAQTAAWGEPAIIMRCGVARPATLNASAQLITVDGVDWFAEELTAGYLFTATGRTAYVEVTVPDKYAPEIGPVTELSPLVANAVPQQENSLPESP
ncbi:MAG: DUF3515 domain-containing protein [Actinomycetes bacterium]